MHYFINDLCTFKKVIILSYRIVPHTCINKSYPILCNITDVHDLTDRSMLVF